MFASSVSLILFCWVLRSIKSISLFSFHSVFDAFYVPPAETFHFAAEFEVPLDLFVVEDAEAVDDSHGAAGHLDDFIGVEGHVGLVADGEDDGIDALDGGGQIIFHLAVFALFLIPEEARPGMAWGGVG